MNLSMAGPTTTGDAKTGEDAGEETGRTAVDTMVGKESTRGMMVPSGVEG